MPYSPVLIYSFEGEFLGYGIRKPEPTLQLKSVNIWTEEETDDLNAQTARLNGDIDIRANWPNVNDPDVLKLINNPLWEPLEMEKVSIMDDDVSHYVFVDETLDEEASVIVYKDIMAPKNPAQAQARTKKAQEIIARERSSNQA